MNQVLQTYERCTRDDLYSAEQVHKGDFDVMELNSPEGRKLLQVAYQTPREELSVDVLCLSRVMRGILAGQFEESFDMTGLLHARNILHSKDYASKGLGDRMDAIIDEVVETDNQLRADRARELGGIAGKANLFVIASDPDDRSKIFGAKLSSVTTIPYKYGSEFEPVVTTNDGEKLLPERFYVFNGLYVAKKIRKQRAESV